MEFSIEGRYAAPWVKAAGLRLQSPCGAKFMSVRDYLRSMSGLDAYTVVRNIVSKRY